MEDDCLPKDKPCQWREGGKYPFSDKGITCPYLRKAVLPADPELEALYHAYLDAADGGTQQAAMKDNCHRCGEPMIKTSNRQKYCASCRVTRRRKMKAKWERDNYHESLDI